MAQNARTSSIILLLLAFVLPVGLAGLWFSQHTALDTSSILFLIALAAVIIVITYAAYSYRKAATELSALKENARDMAARANIGLPGRIMPPETLDPVESLRRNI